MCAAATAQVVSDRESECLSVSPHYSQPQYLPLNLIKCHKLYRSKAHLIPLSECSLIRNGQQQHIDKSLQNCISEYPNPRYSVYCVHYIRLFTSIPNYILSLLRIHISSELYTDCNRGCSQGGNTRSTGCYKGS